MAELSKSQRIKAIKQISAHLGMENYTTIDLTLKTFSLPISNEWSGDVESYVVDKIQGATDKQLVELAEHLGIDEFSDKVTGPVNEPTCWQEGKLRVFISHMTAHKKEASDLKDSLATFGMSGFVAHADIEPTTEWQVEIESALSTCELLVALIRPGFVESKWCDQEIGYALGRGVPVFTIANGQDPHGFVSRFQSFQGNGKSPFQTAKAVFEAAVTHKSLQEKMAHLLVDLFVNSGSFASAKERIEYLEKLTVWDDTFSKRLKRAAKENGQIASSWGVPERVEKLIKKWK